MLLLPWLHVAGRSHSSQTHLLPRRSKRANRPPRPHKRPLPTLLHCLSKSSLPRRSPPRCAQALRPTRNHRHQTHHPPPSHALQPHRHSHGLRCWGSRLVRKQPLSGRSLFKETLFRRRYSNLQLVGSNLRVFLRCALPRVSRAADSSELP